MRFFYNLNLKLKTNMKSYSSFEKFKFDFLILKNRALSQISYGYLNIANLSFLTLFELFLFKIIELEEQLF